MITPLRINLGVLLNSSFPKDPSDVRYGIPSLPKSHLEVVSAHDRRLAIQDLLDDLPCFMAVQSLPKPRCHLA
jgi:hypothetical protein